MVQRIFIMGATGKVGSSLVSQIFERGDANSDRHRNPTVIVGVASSKSFLYSDSGLNTDQTISFSLRRTEGTGYHNWRTLLDLLRGSGPVSIVDATALNTLDLHLYVIARTNHRIVTANKIPLTESDFDTFQTLTAEPGRYGFRCAVMAGAEAVDKLRDLRDLGDTPRGITGCFSGTLGFIATELEKGAAFSEIVYEAVKAGYTEPHPARDLDGSDVAKKILILARTSGFNVGLGDVRLEPFVPQEYLSEEDPDRFLINLKGLDQYFKRLVMEAGSVGKVLRYIARMLTNKTSGLAEIKVGLESVARDSPFGQLTGTENQIEILTPTYNTGYIVKAPGAGIEITAQNVRRDLLYQLEGRICTAQQAQ